ncbi:uncharacterized protein Bfra_007761 [Botrytis fragariae]|uniref:Uncharacterized protein n=1 Tax=Botrytis fragariae TaxID=1964551 RepID=A0A8H6EGG7_9HELO|nr:uncharacterized protein Bfra_007761 [Botrytis fragariae]KAF5871246.1 hypothetical protein Bfra_007761 [Botrytis fragariae]
MRSRIKKTPGPGRLNGCLEELQEAHVLGDRRYAKFVVGRRDWVVYGGIDGLIFEWSGSGFRGAKGIGTAEEWVGIESDKEGYTSMCIVRTTSTDRSPCLSLDRLGIGLK